MNSNMQRWAAIVGTLAVGALGVLIFALAARPMTADGEVAQAWVDALCDGRFADLYALSAVPPETGPDAFRAQAEAYLTGGEIPNPCRGQINYNLVRSLPASDSLIGRVERIRYYAEAALSGIGANDTAAIPLWLYQIGGEWRVWASFMGPTYANPVAAGQAASVPDSNGLSVGFARVLPPARRYDGEADVLVGIPAAMQTLNRPWDRYEAQLFVGSRRGQAINDAGELPEEWRADFLPASGGYVPQQVEQRGVLWFRLPAADAPAVLSFTAVAPFTGTLRSAFLDVPLDEAEALAPFDPFAGAQFAGIANGNPSFDVEIDTAGMPMGALRIECARFVLALTGGEWLRATDCVMPGMFEQSYAPDERATVRVTFAGANIEDEDRFDSVLYRRRDQAPVLRYALWEAGEGG